MRHFAAYGLVDSLASDPGSDLTSHIIAHLNDYLGIRHTISLVDRHESNGVERINQEILRHLRTMIHDTRLITKWTDPVTISLVQLIINEQPNPALGNLSPLAATFGTSAWCYVFPTSRQSTVIILPRTILHLRPKPRQQSHWNTHHLQGSSRQTYPRTSCPYTPREPKCILPRWFRSLQDSSSPRQTIRRISWSIWSAWTTQKWFHLQTLGYT